MKNTKTILATTIISLAALQCFSQSINWGNLKSKQKNIVHVTVGYDYGFVFGTAYQYQLDSKIPALLNVSVTFPSGKNMFDDMKTKVGGQIRLYRINNFQFNASILGIYRRYENPLVRLQNFGSELTGVIGYYKSRWFVAAEFGFDKAIVTHFKHSESFKEDIYESVKDGWYEPATGGNFNYGLQAGYSFKRSDIALEAGKVMTQDFTSTLLVPYYLQLGYAFKIGGK
jgi:hypothetical protein